MFGIEGPDLDRFVDAAATALEACEPPPMLTPGIHQAYEAGVQALSEHNQVETVARGRSARASTRGRARCSPPTRKSFMADERLGHEVFGSSSLVVRCPDVDTLLTLRRGSKGN